MKIVYNGQSKTLSAWCRDLGLVYHKVRIRLKYGWKVEEAFERVKIDFSKNLAGEQFGKLKAEKVFWQRPQKTFLWLCSCKCGCKSIVLSNDLIAGRVTSCGCLDGISLAERNLRLMTTIGEYRNHKRLEKGT